MVAVSGWAEVRVPYSPELVKKAESGDAEAQCSLGWCYKHGKGVVKDGKEAVKWYSKAAEQGNSNGQNCLGWCYANGLGVVKDEKEAVKWYTKSAKQGNVDAKINLGG